MDWDLKMPAPWDIVSDQSYFTLPARPGPCAPAQPPRSPPSPNPLDLKLNNLSHTPIPVSKRARNGSTRGGRIAALCSVEGCKADLGKCREYHRRHKVCEGHSKSPIVIVSGREQRFCQQCSRFHLIVEFDDAKRSCRKRLEGHNRRRRKSANDNHLNPGVFFANNHQGSRFGSYQNLFAPVKPESISFSTPMYPTRRQFPFLMDESSPLLSDCALSLLSSPVMSSPVQSSSSIITTSTGIGTEHIPMAVPLVPGYQFGASGEFSGFMGGTGTATGTDRVSTFVVSSFGGNGEVNNFQSSFQSGAGEGSSHSVPFPSWH